MRLLAEDLDFRAIREEFALPAGYPERARAEATAATDRYAEGRRDATDIPFVTIDPPGSRDLDQAVHVERTAGGHRVHYAIADVGALVEPGSALETESLRRGQTVYLPDGSVPLHPVELSEGTASLLPDEVRPAAVWVVDVDEEGETTAATVARATVRSRARLDYAGVQADADSGRLHPSIAELPVVGERLRRRGVRAGAITLRLPAQEVARTDSGWELRIEPRVAADEWNAQISLLVGRAAAGLMIGAGVGLLRTLPPVDARTVEALHVDARALHLTWPEGAGVGEMLDSVDPNTPAGLAMMRVATKALRGAEYRLVTPDDAGPDGTGAAPDAGHAGIGGPYAHVTAPIRRVADRYATEVCLAVCAGTPVPEHVLARLPELPGLMQSSDRAAAAVDRACVDYAEAVALRHRVGDRCEVVVLRAATGSRPAEAFLAEPPVFGDCTGDAEVGTSVPATVAEVDVAARRIRFDVAPPDGR